MNDAVALIIDDEPDILELLTITLQQMNIQTKSAINVKTAKALLKQHEFNVCLTDMCLPDGNGIDIIKIAQIEQQQLPIAVITAHGSMETAISALKAGAFDFVTKPVDLQILRNLITAALKLPTKQSRSISPESPSLLGQSDAIVDVRKKIEKLARNQAPVHIYGASGTGKELVARLIHQQGPRADNPFIPVNCGAIPSELMESEFFGHQKGSFTGATDNKLGLFQAAQKGTLFLDEIADLPLAMQVKLLRAIQEKTIRPIGSHQEINIDVRILSATHKDLQALVRTGAFRQDLYYRINVITLKVPDLKARPQDVDILAKHILSQLNETNQQNIQLSQSAKQALMNHSFPGNVRELENCLERAVALCDDQMINIADLQLPIDAGESMPQQSASSNTELDPYLHQLEKDAIINALEQTKWNKTAAAKLLGISFRALRYRLKKLGLE